MLFGVEEDLEGSRSADEGTQADRVEKDVTSLRKLDTLRVTYCVSAYLGWGQLLGW